MKRDTDVGKPEQRGIEGLAATLDHPDDGAGADDEIPVAATVVLARDAESGPEVLMIERPQRGSFSGAWVFPGGKFEPVDHEGVTDAACEPEAREETIARNAGARETHEESGLVVRPADLVTISRWTPPPRVPFRIRTWFFAAAAPGGELTLQQSEVVAARWIRPQEMLAQHALGEVTLYPPTWVTLHDLAVDTAVAGMLERIRVGGMRDFHSRARRGDAGPFMVWPEDAEYDLVGAAGARHRLELGTLPWRYVREV